MIRTQATAGVRAPSGGAARTGPVLPPALMSLLLRWVASAVALLLVAYLVPGIGVDGVGTAFVAALALGLINATIKPVLKLLSLPIRLLTLGLFTLVINAFLFAVAAWVVPGFSAVGVGAVFVGAIAYGLLTWAITGLIGAGRD